MTLIYPGGGNCDPNDEPCVGPDCIDPGVGDPNPDPGGGGCLVNCGGPTTCTGKDCVNGTCEGPDCSYGNDGDWHVYWMCDSNNDPSSLGEVIIADWVPVIQPHPDLIGGVIQLLRQQNQHFEDSNTGFDLFGLPLIVIGDAFTYLDPNDAISIGDDNEPIITQYPCFTYLGKKYAATPGTAVANGSLYSSAPWSNGTTTNYSTNKCDCEGTPDPPQPETGCQDPTACNYDENVTTHDQATCCYVTGCDDRNAVNYNLNACCDDGSCCYVSGCTDDTATNYNIEACFDDGSCCYTTGCTDSAATNYDVAACEDDGSCSYGDLYTYGIWCEEVPELVGGKETGRTVFETFYNLYDTNSDNWGCTVTPLIGLAGNNGLGALTTVLPGTEVQHAFQSRFSDGPPSTGCSVFIGTTTGNDVASSSFDLPLSSTVSIPFKAQGMCPLGLTLPDNYIISGITATSFETADCGDCCDKITDPNCDISSESVSGCTDLAAYNYNSLATVANNSTCEWAVPRWCISSDDNFTNLPNHMLPDVNPPQVQDHYIFNIPGAFNAGPILDYYNSEGVNVGVGASVQYAQEYGQDYLAAVVDGAVLQDQDIVEYLFGGNGDLTNKGCMRYLGDDIYTGDPSTSFGLLRGPTKVIIGPMRPTQFPYPNVATTSVGNRCLSSNTEPSGCTDSTATNYDPYAMVDDNTCEPGDPINCNDLNLNHPSSPYGWGPEANSPYGVVIDQDSVSFSYHYDPLVASPLTSVTYSVMTHTGCDGVATQASLELPMTLEQGGGYNQTTLVTTEFWVADLACPAGSTNDFISLHDGSSFANNPKYGHSLKTDDSCESWAIPQDEIFIEPGTNVVVDAFCMPVNNQVTLTGLNSTIAGTNATIGGSCSDGELALTVTGISSTYSDLGMAHPTFYTFDFYKKDSPYTGSSLTEGTQVSQTTVNVSSFPVTLTETGITAGGTVQYYRWVARNPNCEYASSSYSFGSCIGA